MKPPISTALATVPIPIRAPSRHAIATTTTPTASFATPNESGECFAIPWCSTSHGASPSFDSRKQSTPTAHSSRPEASQSPRTIGPPRRTGADFTPLRARCGDGATRATRATRSGSHQFQRPNTAIRLGTRIDRISVASIRIATASPSPNSCSPTILPGDQTRKRGDHDQRRRRHDAAGALEPVRDRRRVVGARVPHLAHPRDEEDLVVHREAEQRREQERRDPPLDLRVAVQPDRVVADAEPEDDHERPVARADREQVQADRLERQQHGTEGAQQEDVRQGEHREDHPGERREHDVQEVDSLRGRTARENVDARREARRRDEARAEPVDERLRRGLAVVVPAELQHLGVLRGAIDEAGAAAEDDGRRLGIGPQLPHQPAECGLHGGRADAARSAGVDDDARRHLRARPDGQAQHVEPADRLGRAWDAERRARRQREPERRRSERHRDRRAGGEIPQGLPHDRPREPRPESSFHVHRLVRQQAEAPPRNAAPAVEGEERRLQRRRGEQGGKRDQEPRDAPSAA